MLAQGHDTDIVEELFLMSYDLYVIRYIISFRGTTVTDGFSTVCATRTNALESYGYVQDKGI